MDPRLYQEHVRHMIASAEREARQHALLAEIGQPPRTARLAAAWRAVEGMAARIGRGIRRAGVATRLPRPASARSRRSTG